MIVRKNILITIDDEVYKTFKYIVDKKGATISKMLRNHIHEVVIDNRVNLEAVLGVAYISTLEKSLNLGFSKTKKRKSASDDDYDDEDQAQKDIVADLV